MRVKWFGHSAFLLAGADGTRVITDPYVPGSYDGAVGYGPIQETADGVTVSHDHPDHSGFDRLPGSPKLVKGAGEHRVGSVRIRGVASFHDAAGGAQRGDNTVFVFDIDGVRVCHAGDLGHLLPEETVRQIGAVDVLLVPVGGLYTIDAQEAGRVAEQLRARVVMPMHYKTDKLGFDIAPVDGFIRGRANVKKVGSPEVEVDKESLPAATEVWVLDPAL